VAERLVSSIYQAGDLGDKAMVRSHEIRTREKEGGGGEMQTVEEGERISGGHRRHSGRGLLCVFSTAQY
jgi:hypothetical protein